MKSYTSIITNLDLSNDKSTYNQISGEIGEGEMTCLENAMEQLKA